MKLTLKQNNYKENFTRRDMGKRGQVAIFIIIAIVIVVGAVLIYFLSPDLGFISTEFTPNGFLTDCIKPTVEGGIETLSKQGGYANPEGYILYQGDRVKYLCYQAQYYLPCKVQQPLIKEHFENELNDMVRKRAEECVDELQAEYERRGYAVSGLSLVESSVSVIPGEIRVDIKAPITVTKDITQKFEEFNIETESQIYDLLMLATSIIDFESTYGDSETSLYIQYYPNLDIQKIKLGDGSKIYVVGDVTTGDSFTFATRSQAWPGGYGFEA